MTASEGKNVQAAVDLAQHLFNQSHTRVTTHKLNTAVRQVLQERGPSTPGGRRARIYYVTQTDVAPPTIVLFVNNPAFLDDSYRRFMIHRLRELLPYSQVPIQLLVRPRQRQRAESTALDETDTGQEPLKSRPAPDAVKDE